MKRIQSKMKALECSQQFPHCKFLGEFFKHQRVANSTFLGRTWPKFKLILDIMFFLFTCKYEEDPIKNEGASVLTRLYIDFSEGQ